MANEDLYFLCVYEEVDMLSNVLMCLARYRTRFEGKWPRQISIHTENRLSFDFGEDIEVVRVKWSLRDAIYLHLYQPIREEAEYREPTMIPAKREPVSDPEQTIFRFRNREE